ncbi:MAG: DNA repair protein RecO [Candidatus Krumholzibacteriota bacterium]|nr:DNA repair protein RecO [Candidatus Krumholzibacteriota bacterium]
MSEIIRDRLVILRTYDFGETSVIAVSLTRRHGKLRFIARGAKNGKNRYHGHLRTGNSGEAVFYNKPGRGLQILKEIETSSVFDSGSGDLERLCIFQAGIEVIDRSTIEEEDDTGLFDLFERFITRLDRSADPWAVFFAMEVRLLSMMGFYPSIDRCCLCKKSLAGKAANIDPVSGQVSCEKCCKGRLVHLSAGSTGILGKMETAETSLTEEMKIGRAERSEIGRMLHTVFLHHVAGYRLPGALKILKGVDQQ